MKLVTVLGISILKNLSLVSNLTITQNYLQILFYIPCYNYGNEQVSLLSFKLILTPIIHSGRDYYMQTDNGVKNSKKIVQIF